MQEEADRLLTADEVAARLGVSRRTVEAWRYRRVGPRGISLSRKAVRWPASEVERWLAERAEQDAARDGAA